MSAKRIEQVVIVNNEARSPASNVWNSSKLKNTARQVSNNAFLRSIIAFD